MGWLHNHIGSELEEKIFYDRSRDFLFEIEYMVVPSDTDKNLVAKILLRPHADKFDFFARVVYSGQVKCEALIYEGGPSSYYFDDLFPNVKWEGKNEFVVVGKRSEIVFHCAGHSPVTDKNGNYIPVRN